MPRWPDGYRPPCAALCAAPPAGSSAPTAHHTCGYANGHRPVTAAQLARLLEVIVFCGGNKRPLEVIVFCGGNALHGLRRLRHGTQQWLPMVQPPAISRLACEHSQIQVEGKDRAAKLQHRNSVPETRKGAERFHRFTDKLKCLSCSTHNKVIKAYC